MSKRTIRCQNRKRSTPSTKNDQRVGGTATIKHWPLEGNDSLESVHLKKEWIRKLTPGGNYIHDTVCGCVQAGSHVRETKVTLYVVHFLVQKRARSADEVVERP
jgi:hypothetical protein